MAERERAELVEREDELGVEPPELGERRRAVATAHRVGGVFGELRQAKSGDAAQGAADRCVLGPRVAEPQGGG